MTVRELIKNLMSLPEVQMDRDVLTQGCDCDGELGMIVPRQAGRFLLGSGPKDLPAHVYLMRKDT